MSAAPFLDAAIAYADQPELRPLLVTDCPVPNYRELGLSPDAPYFNGGVMVVDLDVWRRERLAAQMLHVLDVHREHVKYWDQYALNVVLSGRWRPVSPRWNQNSYIFRVPQWLDTPFCRVECPEYASDPWIVHFNWLKPWQAECLHPFADDFMRCLEGSPWHVTLGATQCRSLPIDRAGGCRLGRAVDREAVEASSAARRSGCVRFASGSRRSSSAGRHERQESMTPLTFAHAEQPGLVSVVIPTFRGERFIAAALKTIAQQSYGDWEVIVVEDGSQGPTQSIIEEFARRHPMHRVEYLRNERNSGAAYSRNRGFAASRGEFVAPLDADDRWFPEHLAACVDALNSSHAAVAYGASVMIEDGTDLLLGVWGPEARDIAEFPQSLLRRNFVNPSATVMRRRRAGRRWPVGHDAALLRRLGVLAACVAAGEQFRYVGGLHCLYRKNHAGATTQRNCGTVEEFAEIVERALALPQFAGKACRRSVAKAFERTAKLHACGDPMQDSSADPSRAAGLMLKAWQLRPERVGYLALAARMALASRWHRSRSAAPHQPAVPDLRRAA